MAEERCVNPWDEAGRKNYSPASGRPSVAREVSVKGRGATSLSLFVLILNHHLRPGCSALLRLPEPPEAPAPSQPAIAAARLVAFHETPPLRVSYMASLKKILPTMILPTARHSASIIFAHGFGATAADWVVLASLPQLRPHCKFIFPQAFVSPPSSVRQLKPPRSPLREITIAGGAHAPRMPAWFDILQQDHTKRTQDGDEDQEGMEESLSEIERLVKAEVDSGIRSERVVVGGFSQGAALALLEGVAGKAEIGGVIVLSGYLPLQWKIEKVSAGTSWEDEELMLRRADEECQSRCVACVLGSWYR